MPPETIAGFRLSPQQERLWTQASAQVAEFRAQCVVQIEGPLDPDRLHASLDTLVDRNEILRTVFPRQAGLKVPFQVILDAARAQNTVPAWRILDLQTSHNENHLFTLAEVLQTELTLQLNIENGPILHAVLVSISITQHALILTLPSVCADAASLANLVAELKHAYAGQAGAVDAPEILQYADVVEWQYELLEGEDTKGGRDFWREHVRGLDLATAASLSLPLQISPTRDAFAPTRYTIDFDQSQTDQALALANSLGASLSDVMFAAWHGLLQRATGRCNVPIACASDGRKQDELQAALGLFARSLPVSLPAKLDTTFSARIRETSTAFAEARKWEEAFSWPQIAAYSAMPEPHSLPFAFEFVTLPDPSSSTNAMWTVASSHAIWERSTLKLFCQKQAEHLSLELEFDANRLSAADVARWAEHLQVLLTSALATPETPLTKLPLLSPAQREQQLSTWNQTAQPVPAVCFHQLFEQQAARTPQRTALVCNGTSLTYSELNAKANQLAHHLRSLGVAPDSRVGLCLDRSANLIVALLAILKAGGAYVPLQSDHPKARLAQQLDGSTVLLTEQKLLDSMPEFSGHVLALDHDPALWTHQPVANPALNTKPNNLAYVIFTSGSTGTPKGVGIEHRNLVNYTTALCSQLQLASFPDGLRFATVSALNADLGNTCIFPALASGGALHVLPYEIATDAHRFAVYFTEHAVDVLKIVPSHLQALLASPDAAQVLPRKYLITGGETLTRLLVEKIITLNSTCQLINHYGPTETTIGSLTLHLKDYDWQNSRSASIPIGRPLANTRIYVLDAELQPLPIGVPGELYIAGAGVSRGYLGQPERTAERFLVDPFTQQADARMYRTGDLARWLPDGVLEFLGRADDQVKVRGFRIELGEVEASLLQHPNVQQAVVLARHDDAQPGESALTEKRLVAYIVPKTNTTLTPDDLRAHLKTLLPDYMLPSALVLLDKLPLTSNGKIDRQKLPAPDASTPTQTFVPPTTPTEIALANIWAQVLRLPHISALDNFFDLGGHSLLATQVISRIRRVLDVDLPLRVIFDAPTVAGVAAKIDEIKIGEVKSATRTTERTIQRIARNQALPLSFAQQRLWFLDQLDPDNPLYNVPRALRLRGKLNLEALQRSLHEIVQRHEVLRTTFASENGQPYQLIAPSLSVGIDYIDISSTPETEREARARLLASEQGQRPFNLAQGPLFRATLLQLGDQDQILLLTMHHIVSDAWSSAVMLDELSFLYEAFVVGQPSPLPPLEIQYADYAAWQRAKLQGDTLTQHLAYWRDKLHDAPPVLALPTDFPRPDKQTSAGALLSIPFSPELVHALSEFNQRENATLFMTLLAGFNALLSRITRQDQIVVGTVVANRTSVETEKLIGFFVNLLALRTDISGKPTFRELLARIKETALGAYAHQDMPFDKLVEELHPERNLSHNAIVQVMFAVQNVPKQRRELTDLDISAFEGTLTHSKFDMGLNVVETADGLMGHWVYKTDLFEPATIRQMAQYLETLLLAALATPETPLTKLSLLSPAQREQQLSTWNQTSQPVPAVCFHQLFEQQAARTPQRAALVCNGTSLTYSELNAKANQLAHHLRSLGVAPDSRVGLCLDRSANLIVALLAILKAGGAYVPLQSDHPKARLAQQLDGSTVLLTEQKLLDSMPEFSGHVLALDHDPALWTHQPVANPALNTKPNNLAYVIFTSGSTGTPKGVGIEHRNLVNYTTALCSQLQLASFPDGLRFATVSALNADLGNTCIFPALASGGALHVLPYEIATDAHRFAVYFTEHAVDVLKIVPSHLQALLASPDAAQVLPRKYLITGGETLTRLLVEKIITLNSTCQLINHYGPTETTIGSLTLHLKDYDWQNSRSASIPIGRPLANTRIYVLDAELQPLPIGVPGELYIAGAGVSRGYLGQPERTAERFLVDPFTQQADARMYRTGDLARWLPDGVLEFLGRADDQVKVRGFRIELGEVEASLLQHPNVQQAVVLARHDDAQPGESALTEKRLVAYIVPKTNTTLTPDDLRAHLKTLLPDYMLPSALVLLDKLPLTSNGKIDRQKLPAPDASTPTQTFVPPTTPTEIALANIWAQVLRLPHISALDNFFDLGGHSLLATQVISRIREHLQTEIALRTIFEQPTLTGLAKLVDETHFNSPAPAQPSIQRVSREAYRVPRK